MGMVATTSVVPSALAAGQALGTTTVQVVVPVGVKATSARVVSKWLVSSFVVGVAAIGGALTVHEVLTSGAAPEPTPTAQGNIPRASEREQARASERAKSNPQPARVLEPRTLERSTAPAANVTEPGSSGKTLSQRVAQRPGVLSKQTPRVADVASLDEEIAWLEPARRSLQAKDGRQALAALELATPHVRLLTSEAALLRVEALLLVGRRAEAERLAAPFMSQHPASPHAVRLRRLLDQP